VDLSPWVVVSATFTFHWVRLRYAAD